MYRCCECEALFDEPGTISELVGEFWGAPAYDSSNCCPYCNSTDIDEVSECPCCEAEYTTYGELCDGCVEELKNTWNKAINEFANDHGITDPNVVKEWMEEYHIIGEQI